MADKEKVLFSRGPRATMPSSKVPGTIYITTDTGEMFVDDTDTSRIQIGPSPADVRSLGVSGASAGQTVRITTVNEGGNPTEWEAVEFPEQVQSDWDQADETAADYVKNRPFGNVAYDGILFAHGSNGWRLERVPDASAFYGIQGSRKAEIRRYGSVVNTGSANISASDYDGSVNIEYTSTSGYTIINISGEYGVIDNINVQSSEGIGGWGSFELHIDGLYYEGYIKLSADKVDIDTKSLGLTGATVGQVPVVKSVDGNGKPTEWEAGDSKPFVVTVTYGDNDTLTADKTHAEIVAAYANGAQINAKIVNYPGVNAPSILPLYVNMSDEMFMFSGSGVLDGSAMAMTAIDVNGSWRVELVELAKLGDIPTSLKNPESLTFTGAVSGSYDGSSAMTVNIPSPGSVTAASIEAALGYKPADPANVADRDHTHPADKITAGTFGGKVVANQAAVAILGDAQVRNIKITNVDLIAGTSELASGEVVFVYE